MIALQLPKERLECIIEDLLNASKDNQLTDEEKRATIKALLLSNFHIKIV